MSSKENKGEIAGAAREPPEMRDAGGRFKPGHNVARKPSGPTFTTILRQYLNETVGRNGERRTRLEILAESLYLHTLKGNMRAGKMIFDRIDPIAVVSGGGGGSNQLTLVLVRGDELPAGLAPLRAIDAKVNSGSLPVITDAQHCITDSVGEADGAAGAEL